MNRGQAVGEDEWKINKQDSRGKEYSWGIYSSESRENEYSEICLIIRDLGPAYLSLHLGNVLSNVKGKCGCRLSPPNACLSLYEYFLY